MKTDGYLHLFASAMLAILLAISANSSFAAHLHISFDETAAGVNASIVGTGAGPGILGTPIITTSQQAATIQATIGYAWLGGPPKAAVVLFEPQIGIAPELSVRSDVITQEFISSFDSDPLDGLIDEQTYRWSFYSYPLASLVDLTGFTISYLAEIDANMCYHYEACLPGFFNVSYAMGNSQGIGGTDIYVRSEIPEPRTVYLLGLGLVGLALTRSSAKRTLSPAHAQPIG